MFPEKAIIDAVVGYEGMAFNLTHSDIFSDFYNTLENNFVIENFSLKDVLIDKNTNNVLHFGMEGHYYTNSPMIHKSNWNNIVKRGRSFNPSQLPFMGDRMNNFKGETVIKTVGILNILRFFGENIDYCLQNFSETSIVFLNNVVSLYKDENNLNDAYFTKQNFVNLEQVLDILSGFNKHPMISNFSYINNILFELEYIPRTDFITELIENDVSSTLSPSMRGVIKDYLSISDLIGYIRNCIGYFKNVSRDIFLKNYNFGEKHKSSILVDETLWWPREHNSLFNNLLKSFLELISLFCRETHSLFNQLPRIREQIELQPAEQRLAFAKNLHPRLQTEKQDYDLLQLLSSRPQLLSRKSIAKKVYDEKLQNIIDRALPKYSSLHDVPMLDLYLDNLKAAKNPQERTKIKRQIYNKLNRAGKPELYNDLVSPDIDPTMGDMFKSPTQSSSLDGGATRKVITNYLSRDAYHIIYKSLYPEYPGIKIQFDDNTTLRDIKEILSKELIDGENTYEAKYMRLPYGGIEFPDNTKLADLPGFNVRDPPKYLYVVVKENEVFKDNERGLALAQVLEEYGISRDLFGEVGINLKGSNYPIKMFHPNNPIGEHYAMVEEEGFNNIDPSLYTGLKSSTTSKSKEYLPPGNYYGGKKRRTTKKRVKRTRKKDKKK